MPNMNSTINDFRLTSTALEDLREIARYTRNKWGAAKQNLYLTALDNKFSWLAKNYDVGKARDEIKKRYFSYPEGRHIIFYRIKKESVEILGILHQSMDVKLHL